MKCIAVVNSLDDLYSECCKACPHYQTATCQECIIGKHISGVMTTRYLLDGLRGEIDARIQANEVGLL